MDKGLKRTIIITVATAFLTFITGLILNHYQHVDQLNQDKLKFEHEMKQDRLKFEYDIVSNILKSASSQNDIWEKLQLYSKMGLITTISQESLGHIATDYTYNLQTVNTVDTITSLKMAKKKMLVNLPNQRYMIAKDFESNGYSFLLKGDINRAALAFKKSDSIYPGYHNSYELYKLLKARKYTLNSYYYLILKKYSWGISTEVTDSFRIKLSGNKRN